MRRRFFSVAEKPSRQDDAAAVAVGLSFGQEGFVGQLEPGDLRAENIREVPPGFGLVNVGRKSHDSAV